MWRKVGNRKKLGTLYHSDINVSLVNTGVVVVTWGITSHYFVSQRTKVISNNRLWMPYKVQGVGFCKVEFRLMDILRCSQLGSTSWIWVDIYDPFKYLTRHNIHTLVHIWVRSFRKGVIRQEYNNKDSVNDCKLTLIHMSQSCFYDLGLWLCCITYM